MKILIRSALAGVALVVVLLVVAALMLPRILQREEVREQIERAAESALGRDVRLGGLSVGLLPPSLLVAETRVAGATPDAEPLVEAREVALELALLPLLVGTVLVDSLVIDGATLHLVRTAEGIELPGGAGEGAARADESAAPEPSAQDGAGMTLAVREVSLTDTTLVLDDRSVTPATRTRVGAEITARGSALDEPVDLDATLSLGEAGADGRLVASGSALLGGELDLEVRLDAVSLAPFAPYAGEVVTSLAGLLTGSVELLGAASDPSLDLDLVLRDASVDAAGARIQGPVELRAQLASVVSALSGPFELDATQARVRYGEVLDKSAGKALVLAGTLAQGQEAAAIEDLSLTLDNLVTRGAVALGPRVRADLRTNAAELEGWEEMLLPLAGSPLRGALEVEGMRVETQPTALFGRIALRELVTNLADEGPLALSGALVFDGDVITTEEVVAQAADQRFDFDARVEDLFGTIRYRGALTTRQADVNALTTTFAGRRDTLLGPLNLNGTFQGTVEAGKSPLETLKAELGFDIVDGKLVGVSILEAVMGEMQAVGSAVLDVAKVFAGPELQRFYGEEFELMKGDLRLDGGVGYSRPLSIQYRDYGVELVGRIDLATLSIDMEGQITLYEAIDAVLAQKAGAPDRYTPRRRDIPLAAVKGSLVEPEVKLAADSAARFAATYARDIYGDKLRRKVDKELGAGAGEVVEGVLEGLLGGRK